MNTAEGVDTWLFTLRDGRVFTAEGLRQFYLRNKHEGCGPMAGYFCPICGHELDPRADQPCALCERRQ